MKCKVQPEMKHQSLAGGPMRLENAKQLPSHSSGFRYMLSTMISWSILKNMNEIVISLAEKPKHAECTSDKVQIKSTIWTLIAIFGNRVSL